MQRTVSNGCCVLGKGQSGEGSSAACRMDTQPSLGIREDFLEEVITKLRLNTHSGLPVCPPHLEHCLTHTGCSAIICWMDS